MKADYAAAEKHLVDVGAGLNKLANHHILSIVAGQVERGVAIRVDLVDLEPGRQRDGPVCVNCHFFRFSTSRAKLRRHCLIQIETAV